MRARDLQRKRALHADHQENQGFRFNLDDHIQRIGRNRRRPQWPENSKIAPGARGLRREEFQRHQSPAILRDQCVAPRCRRHRTSVVRARALRNVGYFSAKSPCVQFYPCSAGMRTWLSPTCFESCLVLICPSVLFRSTESEYATQLPPRMSLPCGVCRAVLDK